MPRDCYPTVSRAPRRAPPSQECDAASTYKGYSDMASGDPFTALVTAFSVKVAELKEVALLRIDGEPPATADTSQMATSLAPPPLPGAPWQW